MRNQNSEYAQRQRKWLFNETLTLPLLLSVLFALDYPFVIKGEEHRLERFLTKRLLTIK